MIGMFGKVRAQVFGEFVVAFDRARERFDAALLDNQAQRIGQDRKGMPVFVSGIGVEAEVDAIDDGAGARAGESLHFAKFYGDVVVDEMREREMLALFKIVFGLRR